MRKLLSALLLLVFAGAITAPVRAQSGYGEITGIVTDPSGAVVSGAAVVLSNPSTGISRTVPSNTAGAYRFTAVPIVGTYSIKVTAQGFAPFEAASIVVSVGAVTTLDVKLAVGGAKSTVLVSGVTEPDVQTTTSSVSQLINENTWKSAPLEFRTQNAFVTLTAGANPDSVTGRGAAVDGARTGTGNFIADGYDNNDQGLGGGSAYGGGGALVTISPDALQEYRVLSHDNSAEYGKSAGFATDTVLKSGTNEFHGSLFEYNRIQALAAEHLFNGAAFNGGTALKDSLVRNQFGGSVGGPVWKDKSFFFATIEFHRLRTGSPISGTVVTQDFVNFVNSGAFENFMENDTGQAAPADGGTPTGGLCYAYNGAPCPGALKLSGSTGPVYQKLYAAEGSRFPYATSSFTSQAQGWLTGGAIDYPVNVYGIATRSAGESTNQERASFRFDQRFSNNDIFAATYLIDRRDSIYPYAGNNEVTTFSPDQVNPANGQLFGTTWTHIFNATTTNQFRASYLRHTNDASSPGTAGVPMIATYTDPLSEGFGAYSGFPQPFTENQFQYQDHLTKVIADHTLSMGAEFRRTRNGSKFYNDIYGTFYPFDIENLLTDGFFGDQADLALFGAPTYGAFGETSASIDPTTNSAPDPYRGYRANEVGLYMQDDWRVNHRLTINAGIRWEYFGPPHNFKPNVDSNVFWGAGVTPVTGSPANANPLFPVQIPLMAQIASANFQIRNHNIWNKDLNNFGPRLGFAYDLTGSGKYVLRGGASIGFDRIYNNAFENIRFNPPHYSDNTFGAEYSGVVAGPLEQPGLYAVPFSGNSQYANYGGKPVPRHMDQDLVTPYYEGAHLGIETALGHGYVLETNYIGTRGRKLLGLRDVNNYDGRTACPTTGTVSAACLAAGYPKGFTSSRPNPLFNSDNFRSNAFLSNYNGLQASLKKQFTNGLQFTANYTWSKGMDEVSDIFNTASGQTGITDPQNPRYDYGPADFDHRQALVANGYWESKWKPKNLLLGGWALSGIFTRYTGSPIPLIDSSSKNDPNKDGRFVDRPMLVSGFTHKSAAPGIHKTRSSGAETISFFNPSAFTAVNCGAALWCDSPLKRNQFFGPASVNTDLGVLKAFNITEKTRFRYEANFFNLFNHPVLNNPAANVNSGTFGQITGSGDPRVIQMALRYEF